MKSAVHASTLVRFLLLGAWALTASPAFAQDDSPKSGSRPIDLEHVKRVLTSEIKDMLADTGIPSMSIALVQEDRVVWTEAFGYSNVRLKIPATSSTIYSVGSCLKPVTAMAVMQLLDDGRDWPG